MFASLHALKWADFAATISNLIIMSIHVTVSKCNLITILMVISVHFRTDYHIRHCILLAMSDFEH